MKVASRSGPNDALQDMRGVAVFFVTCAVMKRSRTLVHFDHVGDLAAFQSGQLALCVLYHCLQRLAGCL